MDSKGTQSYTHRYSFSPKLPSHPYVMLCYITQQSSLWYTVEPSWLSILYRAVCTCPSQAPPPSLPHPSSWQLYVCSLSLWVSLCWTKNLDQLKLCSRFQKQSKKQTNKKKGLEEIRSLIWEKISLSSLNLINTKFLKMLAQSHQEKTQQVLQEGWEGLHLWAQRLKPLGLGHGPSSCQCQTHRYVLIIQQ